MGMTRRVAEYLGLTRADETADDTQAIADLIPHRSTFTAGVTGDRAMTIPTVFRAVQIHQTAAAQLSIKVERAQPLLSLPSLVRRPSLTMSRSEFIQLTIAALALHGNAYWFKHKGPDGEVLDLEPLDPSLVTVLRLDRGRPVFSYKGIERTADTIQQIKLIPVPGRRYGLGPIQAAQVDLGGTIDLRDFAGTWFKTSGVPSGVLSTEDKLTPEQVDAYRSRWDETADGGTRVLGHGLKYAPVSINPKDAQWLEARSFSVTEVARLMGVPSSLMLAQVEGTSMTYQNVEQEWIGYVRFTLMAYLRPIEEAFTEMLPRGQVARFNLEALLRSDTKSRYEAHEIGLRAGFLTVAEVRGIEGLDVTTIVPVPVNQEADADA